MFNQYVVARSNIHWKFPSATERAAYTAFPSEEGKFAWQLDDDTLWMLSAAPNTWVAIGSGAGGGDPSNVVSAPSTVAADTSRTIVSYLQVEDDLSVSGNLLITG